MIANAYIVQLADDDFALYVGTSIIARGTLESVLTARDTINAR
jgi:hypothetical protein